MIILSVDLGKARTGLAICDKDEILASPMGVLHETDVTKLAQTIAKIAKDNEVEIIVIGLPKNMDSTEGESAKNARDFRVLLCKICDIQIDLLDERCTTMIAHQFLNDTNTRGKYRKKIVDSVSAVIILQDYINKRKNEQNKS